MATRACRSRPPSLIGLFVGGRGSRLGGVPKGNLAGPDGERFIVRLVRVCREAVPSAELVLVGNSDAYADLGVIAIPDEPRDTGPLGGLSALLRHATKRRDASVIALACDMPFVSVALVRRLATESPGKAALAPYDGEHWEPLAARYATESAERAVNAALLAGERALQCVFDRFGSDALALRLSPAERAELRDCDDAADLAHLRASLRGPSAGLGSP